MNDINYITKLLNIQDKNIIFKEMKIKNNIYFIQLEQLKDNSTHCPKCGSFAITKNNDNLRIIKHTPINGFPCFLIFKQIRFKCKDCRKTFNQESGLINKGCNISTHAKDAILSETKYKQSFKDISNRISVSQTTVSNEFKKNIHDYRCHLTRIICIDEFKANTIAGKYALIIGDPESGEILDILESRLQDYIYHYFNTIDSSERLSVEYVVTDLSESYRTICRNLFWKSIHIADKFHWIKLTTEAFNKTRIKIMNLILKAKIIDRDKIKYANIIKKYYKLLIANTHSKESWFFDQQVHKNTYGFTTYQSVIEYCVNNDSELEEAYLLLQELYKIAKYSSFENARQNILDWCDKVEKSKYDLKEFKKTALTYKSWIKEITNSFILDPITHKRLSNGFIEGKNNFCKVIKRIGFGYSDFDVFRYKIIKANKKNKETKK